MVASPTFHPAEWSLDGAERRPLHPLQWFAQRRVPPRIHARRIDVDGCLPSPRSPRRNALRVCDALPAGPSPGTEPHASLPGRQRSCARPGTPMEAHVYHQNFNPTGHLWLSALLAALPLLALLGLLGGLRWRAHWAGLASLVVAVLVAVLTYKMSVGDALNSGLNGAAPSVLLVLWLTFNAIWIYTMTVETGYFAVLRRTFARISDDQRVH